jgi:hypothetical protein
VIDAARLGWLVLLISALLADELEPAPEPVQAILAALPATAMEFVPITPEVIALRDAYLTAGIVNPRSRNDATHVAAATVARADAIVSWNFRDIVRLDKIKAYNRVNVEHGYGMLTILSPREVGTDESGAGEETV